MKTENIEIRHHGRCIHGKLWLPESDGKVAVVVISHGYNGCGDDHAFLADYLVGRGIAALTYTFCGGSTRDVSGYPTESMTLLTEVEDLAAVAAYARGREEIDGERLSLFGESQGGLVSALYAGQNADAVHRLCLLYPALCIPDNWRERFPDVRDIPESVEFWGMRLGRDFFVSLRDIDVWGTIGGCRAPALIIHGADDPIVPVAYARRAAEIYENARLKIFPGEKHGFSPAASHRVAELTAEFVSGAL